MTFNKSHLEHRSTSSERTEWVEFAVQSDGGSALRCAVSLEYSADHLTVDLYEETKNRERTPQKEQRKIELSPYKQLRPGLDSASQSGNFIIHEVFGRALSNGEL